MAFTKADLAKIAEITKVPLTDIEKAATDPNEVALPIPEKLTVFTEPELNTFQKNKYEDGRKAGVEMGVKEAATKLGIETTAKTIDGLVDAATKKALTDAEKNPDQRVQELTQKVATLQQNVTAYQTQLLEKDSAIAGLKDSYELYRHVPGPVEGGVQYTQEGIVTLMKMAGHEFKRDSDGKMGHYINGQLQTDKLGNAVPVQEGILGFMKQNRYVPEESQQPGGRGAGDKGGGAGKIMKASELTAKFQAEGKSVNGEEYAKAFEALVSDKNSGFDPNA